MKLREIAHARTGDKGDTSQIAVFAYRDGDYDRIRTHLTAERVGNHFAPIVRGSVTRHELPNLCAMIFVMEHALGSGVTRSLAIDPHGKCLGATLLALEIADSPK